MLNKFAYNQLKKAGWYEGRKIDISEQVKYLESLGYEVFDAAKKFMEEFGELDINDKYIINNGGISEKHHTTCIKEICRMKKPYTMDEKVGQKTIPVLIFSDQVYIYISEDGKFYVHQGLRNVSSDELWNSHYGWSTIYHNDDDKYFCLTWFEIAEGKPRQKYVLTTPPRNIDYL